MQFIDTHCHIHLSDYKLDADSVVKDAVKAGVSKLVCVGCTIEDSKLGIEFAEHHENAWASIGLHPHEAKNYIGNNELLNEFSELVKSPKVVAIGECGLDYYYMHSSKEEQKQLLRFQMELAVKANLPLIFHIRDSFDDFWPIFDDFNGLRGVVHSFSANRQVLTDALSRGLYVGLNGIMTFTKDPGQLEAAKVVPLDRLLLETDAPFLTPTPYRGTICQPKHVVVTAEFLADLRNEQIEDIASSTTHNAQKLFNI
ncbi:MAG: TatD family hydrolase [Candidatus Saccharimonadales bacterium]